MQRQPATAHLRHVFSERTYLLVKVKPDGFEVEGKTYDELRGRLIDIALVRKRFEEGALACSSSDGIRSPEGKLCDACDHPKCQPRLKIQLARGHVVYVLELATSSARNFFSLEEETEAQGGNILDWILRLTVKSREYWGEVFFELESEY